MKKIIYLPAIAILLLVATSVQTVYAGPGREKKKGGQQAVLVIKGKVVDKETLSPLSFHQ